MYKGKNILALIPARGGSKGIKDKNIRLLNGKPLVAYTINAAKKSKYIDDVVITTDSQKIASVAAEYGAEVPFLRPKELASDHSKSIDAVIHAIGALNALGRKYDVLVFLQPTSPLRDDQDIDAAVDHYFQMGEQALVSVSPVEDHPILIRRIGEDGKLIKLLNVGSTCRRQDMPAYYRVNGAIYIYSISELTTDTSLNDAPVPYIMEHSHSIDIDVFSDFYVADYLLKQSESDAKN